MDNMISIIIPTLNAEKYIGRCLMSLRAQQYSDGKCKTIIVDNGSVDKTLNIAAKFATRILKNSEKNVSGLRNLAARSSECDILAFIDSDCIAPENWLHDAAEILKSKQADVVGSWYILPDNPSWVQKTWDLQMSSKRNADYSDWIPSGNFIINKSVFEKIGGFDEALKTGEDTNICDRLRRGGYKIFSSPKLAVKHLGEAATLGQFFKKQRWHGVGGVQRLVSEFPRFLLDKTMLFAITLLISLIGLSLLVMFGIGNIFIWFGLAFSIPLIMTTNIILKTKQWRYCFPLLLLYFVYGFARMVSILNIRLWINEISSKVNR